MLPLSVDEQDQKLRAECPQFRLVAHAGWFGVWEGTLRPICQPYRIRIVYFARRYFDGWHLGNPYVTVFVLDPPIGPDPRGTGEPPQHVYRLGIRRHFRNFAFMIPVKTNGGPMNTLSIAIIPWTIKWLFFHEEWVASGEWKGGAVTRSYPTMPEGRRLGPGEPRSAGAIAQRRVPQAWPKDRRFRILSIDGGGIRGIFPAAVLAGLERRYAGGSSIASYFDLVAGTSTGGILALGLGAGFSARDLFDLYALRGGEIFPPFAGRVGA